VAHAATAGSATTAASATNATNATNAANSAQLGGAAPATYLDRVAFENITGNTAIPGNDVTQIMNPTVINVPAGVGYIHITGTASMATGNANFLVWPSVDGGCVEAGAGYEHRTSSNTTTQTTVPVNMVAPVTPGNHSVRLCTITSAATFAGVRTLAIRTVAGDFNG
jgi:hypothetical protein